MPNSCYAKEDQYIGVQIWQVKWPCTNSLETDFFLFQSKILLEALKAHCAETEGTRSCTYS